MARRRRDILIPLAVASAVIGAGYWVYENYVAKPKVSTKRQRQPKVAKSTKISIAVTKSLVEHGLPLGDLLERYPSLVIVTCPDVTEEALHQLNSQIPAGTDYRVIRCETDAGVTHIIKHLRADMVLISDDSPVKHKDIAKFVGSVTKLSTNDIEQTNAQVHDLFF